MANSCDCHPEAAHSPVTAHRLVEMMRVTSIGHESRHASVALHRKLQASLVEEQCIKEMFDAYRRK